MSDHDLLPPRRRPEPALVRLYALLMWLYPASFRREYGEEMLRALRERVRDTRGPDAMVWLWGWALGDLVVSALAERMRAEVPMDAKVWSRVAGAAAVLGGMIIFIPAIYVIVGTVPVLGYSPSSLAPSPITSLLSSILTSPANLGPVVSPVVASLLSLGALLVLATWVRERYPWFVRTGLTLVFLGITAQVVDAVIFVGIFVFRVFGPTNYTGGGIFGPINDTPDGAFSHITLAAEIGALVCAGGIWLLGNATRRVRPLRFGNILPLVLAVPPFLAVAINIVVPSPFQQSKFDAFSFDLSLVALALPSLIAGVAWIALGVSLWRGVARPAPVAVANRG